MGMKLEYRKEFERKGAEQVKEELPFMVPRSKRIAAEQWLLEQDITPPSALEGDDEEDPW